MSNRISSATVLSIIAPGAGQFVHGERLKGVLVWIFSPLIIPWIIGIVQARKTAVKMDKGEIVSKGPDYLLFGIYLTAPVFFLALSFCFWIYNSDAVSSILRAYSPLVFPMLMIFLITLMLFIIQAFYLNAGFSLVKPVLGLSSVILLMGFLAFLWGFSATFSSINSVDMAGRTALIMAGFSEVLKILSFALALAIPLLSWTTMLYALRHLIKVHQS